MTQNPYQDPYSSGPSSANSGDSSNWTPQPNQQQPQYQPQGSMPVGQPYPAVYAVQKPSSDAATWSLILGILGLVCCGGITSPFGLFFGIKGLGDTKDNGQYSGRGLAIAGTVLSGVGILYLLALLAYFGLIIFAMIASSSAAGSY